jgi:hypothetical protein
MYTISKTAKAEVSHSVTMPQIVLQIFKGRLGLIVCFFVVSIYYLTVTDLTLSANYKAELTCTTLLGLVNTQCTQLSKNNEV